ncbi:uncharacterized protein I303_102588 [Kwoniella dejecticola CBS 10117]|uniref:BTB domain-containing protein n=1 Tax=Kwoniella dejecticola CBS 10117 TaxID=1296121 RepID=A0A1A6A962_9TREE|nr:uncharacterized protein I303_02603 [Kwoniella dejecticola CBS 10117]OBR86594.1 hypothetical protein I303_02603 [Kwoniella dejecticola CBS 10117]
MTSAYIGKGGKQYTYHEDFNDETKGLVIITSDCIAMRMDGKLLRFHSPVFEAMLSTCNSDDDSVHLEHPASVFALYLRTLSGQPLKLEEKDWDDFKQAVDLCLRYDTPSFGPHMLANVRPMFLFGHDKAYKLFMLASRFDDILTACRVISSLASFRQDRVNGEDLFWRRQDWPLNVIEPLPTAWI